jgi:hypothetical protein
MVGSRPPDSKQLAVVAEDPANVLGQIREEVARIFVRGESAAGQPGLEPVRGAAAVRVNESAKQLARETVSELELPVLQHNRSQMLAAGSVLRKSEREGWVAELNGSNASIPARVPSDMRVREASLRGHGRFLHDAGVCGVERDHQPCRPGAGRDDAAVAKVRAEQVGVRPRIDRAPRHASGRQTVVVLHATSVPPRAKSAARDTSEAGDVRIAVPCLNQGHNRLKVFLTAPPHPNICSHVSRTAPDGMAATISGSRGSSRIG